MVVGSSPVAVTIALVVAKLKFFQSFTYKISIHAGLIFEGFWGPYSHKLKFAPEVVF